MLINVYNTVSLREETIDTKYFDASIHFHQVTRKEFPEVDIAIFSADKVVEVVEPVKTTRKSKVVEEVVEVVEEVPEVEVITE